MRKLLNRKIIEQNGHVRFVSKNLRTIAMLCRITKTRREWEELGEMITGQHPSNTLVVQQRKKDQPGWINDGRLADGTRCQLQLGRYQPLAINHARTEALGSSLKRHQLGTHTFGGDGTVTAHRNCVYQAQFIGSFRVQIH
jgi:hypothetical protein